MTRILIRDGKHGRKIQASLEKIAEARNLDFDIENEGWAGESKTYSRIRDGFNVYILHLSQTDLGDVHQLRWRNKDSLIVGIWGGASYGAYLGEAIRTSLDGLYRSDGRDLYKSDEFIEKINEEKELLGLMLKYGIIKK